MLFSMQRPPTIADVAKATRVALSTVSRALSGRPGVSDAKRAEIVEVARRMGYRPNPYVSALMAQVTPYRHGRKQATIMLLDCWDGPQPSFIRDLGYVTGAHRRAESLGYHLDEVRFRELGFSPQRLRQVADARGIRGLLIHPVGPEHSAPFPEGELDGLACATIDPSLRTGHLLRASPDYYQHMELALQTLLARGYRRIGYFVTDAVLARLGYRWMGAFQTTARRHPDRFLEVCEAPGETALRLEALGAWLRAERPDAVVSLNIPQEATVKGRPFRWPDATTARVSLNAPRNPGWAGIDEREEQVGAAAVDLIVDSINRNEYAPYLDARTVMIEGVWREGATLRPQ